MNRQLKAKIIEIYGSQAEFAYYMALDESLVSRVVNGRRTLCDECQKEWAEALECNVEDVFGG